MTGVVPQEKQSMGNGRHRWEEAVLVSEQVEKVALKIANHVDGSGQTDHLRFEAKNGFDLIAKLLHVASQSFPIVFGSEHIGAIAVCLL